jgi:preprotein translocase subunit SecD
MTRNSRTLFAGLLVMLLAAPACSGSGDDSVTLEMRMLELEPADSLERMTMLVWGGEWTYYAHREVLLTEADVAQASVIEVKGRPAIELVMSDDARGKLIQVTRDNIGRRLGIIIDGHLLCAPKIEEPNATGVVVVTGQFMEPAAIRCSRALSRHNA